MATTMKSGQANENRHNNLTAKISRLEAELYMAQLYNEPYMQISECLRSAYDTLESFQFVPDDWHKDHYNHCI